MSATSSARRSPGSATLVSHSSYTSGPVLSSKSISPVLVSAVTAELSCEAGVATCPGHEYLPNPEMLLLLRPDICEHPDYQPRDMWLSPATGKWSRDKGMAFDIRTPPRLFRLGQTVFRNTSLGPYLAQLWDVRLSCMTFRSSTISKLLSARYPRK